MFTVYKKGVKTTPEGFPLNYSFMMDDDLVDTPPEYVSNYQGSLGACMLKCDEFFRSSMWQFRHGTIFCSNPTDVTIMEGIELATQFFKTPKAVFAENSVVSDEYNVEFSDGSVITFPYALSYTETQNNASIEGYNVSPMGSAVNIIATGENNEHAQVQIIFNILHMANWDNTTKTMIFNTNDEMRGYQISIFSNNDGTYKLSIGAFGTLFHMTAQYAAKYNGMSAQKQPSGDQDPYEDDEGGSSGDGGGSRDGQHNYTDDSDSNPIPDLPDLSAVDTGFITLYTPTTAQLQSLASYLWGNLFDISTWKKVLADPMDAIIGLSIVPVSVPTSGGHVVTVGNISTGISLNKASKQYIEINCGTVAIEEKWKAYLDYSPYTKVSIFLPFIGSQELDIDLIQSETLGVVYHIDILSGACVAFVTVDSNVIAQFSGQCAVSIPLTTGDLTQTIMSLCGLVAGGIGVVASGGMSAPMSAAAITGAITATASTAANVISGKPTYAKSGNMSGSNGLMGSDTPYLIIERPKQCLPASQNRYTGYPSYVTRQLAELSGFTQVQDIHLDGINCNDVERDEILNLLRQGVIL